MRTFAGSPTSRRVAYSTPITTATTHTAIRSGSRAASFPWRTKKLPHLGRRRALCGDRHLADAGVPEIVDADIILTNDRRCHGPNVADHVFGHRLTHTRYLKKRIDGTRVPVEGKSRRFIIDVLPPEQAELRGKTMLIVGVDGVGGEVARRADAFRRRVLGVDPRLDTPRAGVNVLRPPAALEEPLPRANVLVLSCPLTRQTRGLIGKGKLALLPDRAYLINVSRGRVVDKKPGY